MKIVDEAGLDLSSAAGVDMSVELSGTISSKLVSLFLF
jgi:hypothetical protein